MWCYYTVCSPQSLFKARRQLVSVTRSNSSFFLLACVNYFWFTHRLFPFSYEPLCNCSWNTPTALGAVSLWIFQQRSNLRMSSQRQSSLVFRLTFFLGSTLRCTLVERLSLKALQLVVYIQGQGGSQRSVLATLHTSPPLYTLLLLSKIGVLVTGLFGKITKVVRLSACKSNIRKMRAGVRRIPTIWQALLQDYPHLHNACAEIVAPFPFKYEPSYSSG